jgi:hypothetical protein
VLFKEYLQVPPVNVPEVPIINRVVGLLVIEALIWLKLLLHLFGHSIKSNFPKKFDGGITYFSKRRVKSDSMSVPKKSVRDTA